MKTIIFILAAVQILHCSGQFVNEFVDASINKLNEETTLSNLVAVTGYEIKGIILTNKGLEVKLTFNVQETKCVKEAGVVLAECSLKPLPFAVTASCISTVRYANCAIQNVDLTCKRKLIMPTAALATTKKAIQIPIDVQSLVSTSRTSTTKAATTQARNSNSIETSMEESISNER
ncbi:secreted phosphoprotein 24-like [Heptranchias perlo]|uniref:secreted phosphoprotein 24-like n=1 Tax=Heptranchias perlo TaxID=212740 RepID=UPI00355A59B9